MLLCDTMTGSRDQSRQPDACAIDVESEYKELFGEDGVDVRVEDVKVQQDLWQ